VAVEMLQDLDSLMEKYEIDALLATGNAFENPNIFWLTGFRSPDAIVYLKNKGEEALAAAALNTIDRLARESFIKRTHDFSDVYLAILREGLGVTKNWDRLYKSVLDAEFSGERLGVPDELRASHLMTLLSLGYKVKVVPDLLREARATKSPREVNTIRKAGKATMDAMGLVIDVISDAEVGANRVLLHKGQPLTAGRTKLVLEQALLDRQAESAEDAIVAVGRKAFDWHYLGRPSDRLRAGVPIIMDVFPRLKLDRYVGIGLEVHEEPSLYDRESRFSEGHVVAIEPGVYLRSVGGVRVENDYLVTKSKAKLLTPGIEQTLFV
jgi:Xaa-Pro aminopeptidase